MADQVHDLTPAEVSKGIAEGRYLLVDVREPNEVAVEAYPQAVVVPLSGFDPQDIPDPDRTRGGSGHSGYDLGLSLGRVQRLIFLAPKATLAFERAGRAGIRFC